MTRPSTDHVTFHAAGYEFRCGHCGDFTGIADGSTVSASVTRLQGFALMHKHCPKPEAPSRQMALPGTEGRVVSEVTYPGHTVVFEQLPPVDVTACRIADGWTDPAPIDASTDEPAPEIDPPGPYARFEEMYPLAKTIGDLWNHLCSVLTAEQIAIAMPKPIEWWPATGIFNAVANWARIEKAHADAGKREPIAGLTIPRREPMPEKLAELLGVKPKQKKGARPLTSPKRKGEPKK